MKKSSHSFTILTSAFLLGLFSHLVVAAEDPFAKVQIKTIEVTDNVYMLVGAGGNIGVSKGPDGLLMIDDQFGPLASKIAAALEALGDSTPTYVLNTHYHGDHTGSNAHFGTNSIIMAQHNVRLRLISEGKMPDAGLPTITYDSRAHLFFNNEDIEMIHAPSGHTDGDSMVYFRNSNVIHMGDNMFNGRFPYIDLDAGGSVKGMISAVEMILTLINDDTKIIPGHGSLATKADLEAYLEMLKETSRSVAKALKKGQSEDEIINKGLGEKWQSWGAGFITEERWIQTLVKSL